MGHPGASRGAAPRGKRAQICALSVQSPVLDTMQRVVGLALAVSLVRSWKRFVSGLTVKACGVSKVLTVLLESHCDEPRSLEYCAGRAPLATHPSLGAQCISSQASAPWLCCA